MESAEGAGTTFRIYLPRVPKAAMAAAPESGAARGPAHDRTILLVEDDAAVRHLAGRLLTTHGYQVLVAADAAEALRISTAHAAPIHLLLTDVVMPGANGRELAERLVQARPELRVLYMSGYPNEAAAELGVLAEGVHLLPKPFTERTLAARVRELLDESDARVR